MIPPPCYEMHSTAQYCSVCAAWKANMRLLNALERIAKALESKTS